MDKFFNKFEYYNNLIKDKNGKINKNLVKKLKK